MQIYIRRYVRIYLLYISSGIYVFLVFVCVYNFMNMHIYIIYVFLYKPMFYTINNI